MREGLANVARHAHADRVAVRVVADRELVIELRDDGVGIDPGSARSGLVNLGTRAAARSGTFELRRGEPAGTRAVLACADPPRLSGGDLRP